MTEPNPKSPSSTVIDSQIKIVFRLLVETSRRYFSDDVQRMAAALSYYTIFSLAPLLIIAMALAGFVFGRQAAHDQLINQLNLLMDTQTAEVVDTMVKAARKPFSGTIATLLGLFTLMLGASGVLRELKSALNKIWKAPARKGVKVYFINRLVTLTMVLAIGFLLLASLILSTILAGVGTYFSHLLPFPGLILESVNSAVSFGVISVLFAMIYKFLPDAPIRWRDVWIGAVLTSALFTVGKTLLGLYLGKSGMSSSYGAAGSIVVLLVWVYYSALILYVGAEFTSVYSSQFGSRS